jgi:hypothetical protein
MGFFVARPFNSTTAHLLAVAHRLHQRADNLQIAARAVEGLFDGQHLGVGRGLFRENPPRC